MVRLNLMHQDWEQCFIVKISKAVTNDMGLMEVSAQQPWMMFLAAQNTPGAQDLLHGLVSPQV